MKIYIVDRNNITKFFLPDDGDDFFTYSYKIPKLNSTFLITFERVNGRWNIKSNGLVNLINKTLGLTELYEHSNYQLQLLGYNGLVYLYAMPDNESYYNLSVIDNITIGSSANSIICYANELVAANHAVIKKDAKGYLLKSLDNNYGVYVNKTKVYKHYLKAGDIIFINGLKIIWMMKNIMINNPNKQVKVAVLTPANNNFTGGPLKFQAVSDESKAVELYTEDDYFYHKPTIKEVVEGEEIEIDLPPGKEEMTKLPWYITLGTSLTMVGMSFIFGFNVYQGITNNKPITQLLPQIVMLVSMLFGSLIMPKVMNHYNKKMKLAKEAKRVKKYTEYLDETDKKIDLLFKQKNQIYNANYIPASTCKAVAVQEDNRYFWSRELDEEDFLKVRLGLGEIDPPVVVSIAERHFSLVEDELLDKAYELQSKYKKMSQVPITISLAEKNIASLICDTNYIDLHSYFNNILVQLVALHSAVDLKIVILTNAENRSKWDDIKFLPHCFSEDKSVRFFSSTETDTKEISDFLENEFKMRKDLVTGKEKDEEGERVNINKGISIFDCYYLIITDCFKNSAKIPIIEDILKEEENIGFGLLTITNSIKNVPAKCNTFIEITSKDGCVFDKKISMKSQQKFNIEYDADIDFNAISKYQANIPILTKEGLSVLPSSLSFLDMYGVSRIEQLNIANRWRSNDPVMGLSAPIGVYANGDQFMLNLHEKYHGPHGLIAGSTGSGKSEFIITYILSMCINYHPYEVQFVLIDYKGGGLAGAFENRETGMRVPHLVGTITNLDTAEMNRTLVSIESELKRRQKVFNEVRDSLGESTIDIYKYQRLYREGMVKEPMSHLFIISDEFAELKSQQPDFMAQLISTARIGRSLGVHLILATQKPSGVVNDQIWSNSKFKVCLKVQDRGDSMEMLKKPDAASIKEAGRFYLQVGYDDFFDKGQSGWAGAKYVPSDKIVKKVDDSINFIDDSGTIIKSAKENIKVETTAEDLGDQLTNIVKYIYDLGNKEKIVQTKLWLDAIPAEIYVTNLQKKYNYEKESYVIKPIIGEYDVPASQEQRLLTIDLSHEGNTLIMGKQGSGKENLITTILLSTITEHTPSEVNFYIIDCGTESLKIFNKMPHVGDIACLDDNNKTFDIFDMLFKELDRRKELMSDYGGSYQEYINRSDDKLPLIVTIINNYEVFTETYGRFAESLFTLYRDGWRYGLVFIISELSPNTLRARQMQNFPNKLCLQLPNDEDYRNQLNAPRGLYPSKFFGRGLCILEKGMYEFQTAYYTKKEDLTDFVLKASETYNNAYKVKAKKIPTIPNKVMSKEFYEELTDLASVPIGYSLSNKEPFSYDFRSDTFTQIVTNTMTPDRMNFLYALMHLMAKLDNTKVKVVDFVQAYEREIEGVECYNDDFDNNLIKINNDIIKNKDEETTTVYFFLGIGAFKNHLSDKGRNLLGKIFSGVTAFTNTKIILMDVLASYKNIQVELWYQANVNNSNGIWLAEDAASQLVINAPNITVEERKLNFPCISYAIVNSNHTIIKHMIEEEEKNE